MTVVERVSAEGRARAPPGCTGRRCGWRRRCHRRAHAGGAPAGARAVVAASGAGCHSGGGRWRSGLTAFAVWRVPRRIAPRVTDEALARTTEHERGLRGGALVGLVQLSPVGGALVRHQAAYVAGILGPGTLAPRHARRLAFAAIAAIGATASAALGAWSSASTRGDGWRALVHPIVAARGALLEPLSLAGDTARHHARRFALGRRAWHRDGAALRSRGASRGVAGATRRSMSPAGAPRCRSAASMHR